MSIRTGSLTAFVTSGLEQTSMRIALLLRQRRVQLLRQMDLKKGNSPVPFAGRFVPPPKRSASQAAAALKTDDSRKHARVNAHDVADQTQGASSSQKSLQASSATGHQSRFGHAQHLHPKPGRGRGNQSKKGDTGRLAVLPEPLMDESYIHDKYAGVDAGVSLKGSGLGTEWKKQPKASLTNFMSTRLGQNARCEIETGLLHGRKITRATIKVTDDVVGVGDGANKRDAERMASLAACYEVITHGLHKRPTETTSSVPTGLMEAKLSDGTRIEYEKARQFMDYYCRKFRFGQPFIEYEETGGKRTQGWEAIMTVGGRKIGMGTAKSKKDAMKNSYVDVVCYLEKCDPELWKEFAEKAKTGKDLGPAPEVWLQMSMRLEDDIRGVNLQMKRSTLFRNMPDTISATKGGPIEDPSSARGPYRYRTSELTAKSAELLKRRKAYLSDPAYDAMRRTRQALPVYSKAEDILKHVEENDVTVLMAATGSGKTTQIPQLILDSFIDKSEGATCNIFCTQPRRLAAISVAQRVAKERGERAGKNSSIGYQVRFEAALPDENGSVTFCTIGVFLRRMQSALQRGHDRILDAVTHIIVDEVHERDIDTDLLLVVLKRLIEDRKAKGNPLKVILMSATVDSTLFRSYFTDTSGKPASLIEIPGRSFPVEKHFLDEFLPSLMQRGRESQWVFRDEKVARYIQQELPDAVRFLPDTSVLTTKVDRDEELEIPYALVALTISHVLRNSDSGHVLVFLPGWEEIQSVQKILTSWESSQSLGLDFNDGSKFALHVLHSSIPLAEQEVIFDPPPEGVRRIILSTNVAETSVTIPDVVYVVDTAKIKENRYDPERHISSLVSAWVGKSNLNQRAGRAGRHRPGEYYGILSQQRADNLHSHQTVEMKRMDLSNVVMHVKALDFPGMDAEDVLARTIEPPSEDHVDAAMMNLKMVGALDEEKNLTSLGRILLQLPVDVQLGRLVLYGSFFKCLDQALTLAAIFSSRDPFLSPPLMRKEAQAVKDSWCPEEFRSDALACLRAFNAWYQFELRGDRRGAARFCGENFLSKSTLLMAAKVKKQLLESLAKAGILDVSAGGASNMTSGRITAVPLELNANEDSLPLLAALIAIASQPKFAIRTGPMTYRTAQDKFTVMHPSSVNHKKRVQDDNIPIYREKQLFTYSEKRQNLSSVAQGPGQMTLIGTTRLDPMTYVLFGAYNLEASAKGLECDEWLPITGNIDALDEVRRLKLLMEGCLLRVFEGINNSNASGVQRRKQAAFASNKYIPPALRQNRDIDEDESGDEEDSPGQSHGPLTEAEIVELDSFTQAIVDVLDRYADERRQSQSRMSSRTATPTLSPSWASRSLPGSGWRSGTSTPLRYESRPSTPSWPGAKGG
ncbi:hypothetical protein ACEPAG_697 [Sanghuangporus baumii]